MLMCHVGSRQNMYVMTHQRALEIAEARGYLATRSRRNEEGYSCIIGPAIAGS